MTLAHQLNLTKVDSSMGALVDGVASPYVVDAVGGRAGTDKGQLALKVQGMSTNAYLTCTLA